MEASWKEKRDDLGDGIGRLPAPARRHGATAGDAERQAPSPVGMRPHPASASSRPHTIRIALDPRTGAIIALVNKNTQRAWASPKNPLALFTYQTLGPEAYDAFIAAYLTGQNLVGTTGLRQAQHRAFRRNQHGSGILFCASAG